MRLSASAVQMRFCCAFCAASEHYPDARRRRVHRGRTWRHDWQAQGQSARAHAQRLSRARGLRFSSWTPTSISRARVDYMAAIKRPVTVVATSKGTLRAAHGIAGGAKPDALVLTAGFLTDGSGSRQNVANILGSPRLLPRTLVIAHRHDSCRFTLPAGVEPFIRWAGGKASVKWLDGGMDSGDPCQARGYHGFNGLDGEVVSAAAGFH